jgi:mono/diheme cytochrome c family protein
MHKAGLFLAAWLIAAPAGAQAEPLGLSEGLLELLRTEMREVSAGMQGLIPAIAIADWAKVREIGRHIEQSYILNARLSGPQRAELKGLPAGFKALDRRFHEDAAGLADAAQKGDAALVLFRSERLIGGCVACHEAYAPRFAAPRHAPENDHGH